MNHWVSHLNPEQKQAALHDKGPMLILAGAGSGKTTVLVSRTGRLIEQKISKADRICVLTFTNKSAKELQKRVKDKLGKKLSKGLWAGTFHSFGLETLRKFYKQAGLPKYFGILSQGDALAIVKELLKQLTDSKDAYDADKILSMLSDWRNRGQTKAKLDDDYQVATEWMLPKYKARLRALGVVDFDDLLLGPLRLSEEHEEVREALRNRFDQLMVDEFQDTNHIQMKLVMLLAEKTLNISVVGDDDQSIYGWRGAEVKNILNFPHLFDKCKVVRLERNYRSTSSILDVANAVIAKNEKRHEKVLKAENKTAKDELPELFLYSNEDEEAMAVVNDIMQFESNMLYNFKDMAVLYRSNSQGALIEVELRKRNIPYKLNGGTAFFDRREIKDILAYLRAAILPSEISLRRSINTPPRGIGEKSIDKIQSFSESELISFYNSAKRWSEAGISEQVGISIDSYFSELRSFIPRVLEENNNTCGENLLNVMGQMGYKSFIGKLSKDHKQAVIKWQIVEIFAKLLDRYIDQGGRNKQTILKFVDSMELRDQIAESNEKDTDDKVQLMTFHASKGLEYPVCYMIGLEEDIIPHRTLGEDISEERRLFYVGATRAKEKLIMSRSLERRKFGRMKSSAPSRFLLEIPKNMIQVFESGHRPVSESQRKSLIADLFSKIDSQAVD